MGVHPWGRKGQREGGWLARPAAAAAAATEAREGKKERGEWTEGPVAPWDAVSRRQTEERTDGRTDGPPATAYFSSSLSLHSLFSPSSSLVCVARFHSCKKAWRGEARKAEERQFLTGRDSGETKAKEASTYLPRKRRHCSHLEDTLGAFSSLTIYSGGGREGGILLPTLPSNM